MADVFLSYAREDIGVAERLAQLLANSGLEVWWDRRLVAGDDLNVAIGGDLEKARSARWSGAQRRLHGLLATLPPKADARLHAGTVTLR